MKRIVFPSALKKLQNRRGDFSPLIAGIIIVVALGAVITSLIATKKVRTKSSEGESATEVCAKKLEDLMNLSFNHADLDTATAVNPHKTPDNALLWEVTTVSGEPKLKKIVVRSAFQQKTQRTIAEQSVAITGYKYNDF